MYNLPREIWNIIYHYSKIDVLSKLCLINQ